jgi:hypothetical protein
MIALLAPLLPAVLLIALLGRTPVPASGLPPELRDSPDPALVPIGAQWLLFEAPGIRARYLAQREDSTPTAIVLTPEAPVTQPDLLLYWVETPGDSTALPADAVLLGPLKANDALKLPASNRGYLILYSLAHRERIAVAQLQPIP